MNNGVKRLPHDQYFEKDVVISEVDLGQPCEECSDCSGYSPHSWRKTCSDCKCARESHAVFLEELQNVSERLGFKSNSGHLSQEVIQNSVDPTVFHYSWAPPGLNTLSKIDEFFSDFPPEKVPRIGTPGERYRDKQLSLQLPRKDLALTYCKYVSSEHQSSYEDFVSARNEIALDIGYVIDAPQRGLIECYECQKVISPGRLCVVSPRFGCVETLNGGGKIGDRSSTASNSMLSSRVWHPACFICKFCKEPLVDLAHCVHDGAIYCERHYAEILKPRCAGCDEFCRKMGLLLSVLVQCIGVIEVIACYEHFRYSIQERQTQELLQIKHNYQREFESIDEHNQNDCSTCEEELLEKLRQTYEEIIFANETKDEPTTSSNALDIIEEVVDTETVEENVIKSDNTLNQIVVSSLQIQQGIIIGNNYLEGCENIPNGSVTENSQIEDEYVPVVEDESLLPPDTSTTTVLDDTLIENTKDQVSSSIWAATDESVAEIQSIELDKINSFVNDNQESSENTIATELEDPLFWPKVDEEIKSESLVVNFNSSKDTESEVDTNWLDDEKGTLNDTESSFWSEETPEIEEVVEGNQSTNNELQVEPVLVLEHASEIKQGVSESEPLWLKNSDESSEKIDLEESVYVNKDVIIDNLATSETQEEDTQHSNENNEESFWSKEQDDYRFSNDKIKDLEISDTKLEGTEEPIEDTKDSFWPEEQDEYRFSNDNIKDLEISDTKLEATEESIENAKDSIWPEEQDEYRFTNDKILESVEDNPTVNVIEAEVNVLSVENITIDTEYIKEDLKVNHLEVNVPEEELSNATDLTDLSDESEAELQFENKDSDPEVLAQNDISSIAAEIDEAFAEEEPSVLDVVETSDIQIEEVSPEEISEVTPEVISNQLESETNDFSINSKSAEETNDKVGQEKIPKVKNETLISSDILDSQSISEADKILKVVEENFIPKPVVPADIKLNNVFDVMERTESSEISEIEQAIATEVQSVPETTESSNIVEDSFQFDFSVQQIESKNVEVIDQTEVNLLPTETKIENVPDVVEADFKSESSVPTDIKIEDKHEEIIGITDSEVIQDMEIENISEANESPYVEREFKSVSSLPADDSIEDKIIDRTDTGVVQPTETDIENGSEINESSKIVEVILTPEPPVPADVQIDDEIIEIIERIESPEIPEITGEQPYVVSYVFNPTETDDLEVDVIQNDVGNISNDFSSVLYNIAAPNRGEHNELFDEHGNTITDELSELSMFTETDITGASGGMQHADGAFYLIDDGVTQTHVYIDRKTNSIVELIPDIQHDQLTIQDYHDSVDRPASPYPPDEVSASSNRNKLHIPDSVIEGESSIEEDKNFEEEKSNQIDEKDVLEPLPEKNVANKNEHKQKLGDKGISWGESTDDIVLFQASDEGIMSNADAIIDSNAYSEYHQQRGKLAKRVSFAEEEGTIIPSPPPEQESFFEDDDENVFLKPDQNSLGIKWDNSSSDELDNILQKSETEIIPSSKIPSLDLRTESVESEYDNENLPNPKEREHLPDFWNRTITSANASMEQNSSIDIPLSSQVNVQENGSTLKKQITLATDLRNRFTKADSSTSINSDNQSFDDGGAEGFIPQSTINIQQKQFLRNDSDTAKPLQTLNEVESSSEQNKIFVKDYDGDIQCFIDENGVQGRRKSDTICIKEPDGTVKCFETIDPKNVPEDVDLEYKKPQYVKCIVINDIPICEIIRNNNDEPVDDETILSQRVLEVELPVIDPEDTVPSNEFLNSLDGIKTSSLTRDRRKNFRKHSSSPNSSRSSSRSSREEELKMFTSLEEQEQGISQSKLDDLLKQSTENLSEENSLTNVLSSPRLKRKSQNYRKTRSNESLNVDNRGSRRHRHSPSKQRHQTVDLVSDHDVIHEEVKLENQLKNSASTTTHTELNKINNCDGGTVPNIDENTSSSTGKPFWLIFSGEYTKAMNKDWHGTHFCCWQCDESLTGQRYVLRDDHPYCVACYESVFANACEECSKTIGIDSKDLSYKDKHWHEACFLCSKCRVSLVDKQFGSKLDKIYCGNCYDAQFASRCDGCGEIFRAGTKKMEYKTRQWHEKCFCCCVCKSAIGTKSFIPREQEIYCAQCYEEKFATRCVKCNKIITSGGVTYKNEPWHRECFTCFNCNTSLAGQRFTSRDDKPYCAECFGELFAKRCTACSKPITGIGGTRFISFEERHWHNDCFVCASCNTSLVGKGFITDDQDIICPECAKQKLM